MTARRETHEENIESATSRAEQMARLCEKYIASQAANETNGIERLLDEVAIHDRPCLVRELVAADIRLRISRDQQPLRQDYLDRFPDYSNQIHELFDSTLARDAQTIDAAAAASNPMQSDQPEAQTQSFAVARHLIVEPSEPSEIGRFSIVRKLGAGSFGNVYLAMDQDLHRPVALKVPRQKSFTSPEQVDEFLNEARAAAQLKHPNIVAVHDIGRQPDGNFYIVLEYIEGRPLSNVLREGQLGRDALINLLVRVAEGVHQAHLRGLVHRDIKPANILVDATGEPHLADFGLALHEDVQSRRSGEIAGTSLYMAPEQIRGEAHRLDGRTDIWALGVILYRILTGRLPFADDRGDTLFDEIVKRDPKPPRQINPDTPQELERICLKCLSKRMGDRYETALDLASELSQWLDGVKQKDLRPASRPEAPSVFPKGLRSFDKEDAEFFLSLLPGPFDREGLPESLRFWKSRIERQDEKAFSVGLVYGPSGCGKSSLIKAGLLPRIAKSVRTIYLEASRDNLESRLVAALRREFPDLPAQVSLNDAFALLRQGSLMPRGGKVLIVIDQLEQWLHGRTKESWDQTFLDALRQCDGKTLQVLLLVRDDFWMAIAQLFKAIEVPLSEGENSAPVEPFDSEHARSVLSQFGRAYRRIPELPNEPGPEVHRFLDAALQQMAGTEGRITPVRLTVFAEMVSQRPWTLATLRELGGVEGIGVTFLSESFDSPSAPPSYRFHQKAVQAVLQALLPVPGSVIRGAARSWNELQQAAHYDDRPGDFADLIRILDTEVRLITPVDQNSEDVQAAAASASQTRYQLAHDFLVVPLRQWIERKQRATRAGRARRRLETITSSWIDQPIPQRLPSPLEWAGIHWNTQESTWSLSERRMMQAANRRYLGRAALAFILTVTALLAFHNIREGERARSALDRALKADYRNLPSLLPELTEYRGRIREKVTHLAADPTAAPREREIAALLLFRDEPSLNRAQPLHKRLLDADPEEVAVIRESLISQPSFAGIDELRAQLLDPASSQPLRLRIACTLSGIEPFDQSFWSPLAVDLTRALLAEERRTVTQWLELLGPATGVLTPELRRICGDANYDASTRSAAAEALADVLRRQGDTSGLAGSIIESQLDSSLILLGNLERSPQHDSAIRDLREILSKPSDSWSRNETASRQAMAAIALGILGQADAVEDALRHRADPQLRTFVIHKVAQLGLAPRLFEGWIARSNLDHTIRQSVLMTWAETTPQTVPATIRTSVVAQTRQAYLMDPDPGVHSAADLLLRRWDSAPLPNISQPDAAQRRAASNSPRTSPAWRQGPNGHLLVALPGPISFTMGSPEDEPDRFPYENRHLRRIDRSIEVATTEVTVAQYQGFRPNYTPDPRYVTDPKCPAADITWYEALKYCNWLSEITGIPRDEWCYPEETGPGMTFEDSPYKKTGFRLPSEAEWEYFTRAGTESCRPNGDSEEFVSRYAWTWLNSKSRVSPVASLLPNEFGLFDTLGSMWEWTQDGPFGEQLYSPYPTSEGGRPVEDHFQGLPVNGNDWRTIRGGVFDGSPSKARSGHRDIFRASAARYFTGVRVVRTIPDKPQ